MRVGHFEALRPVCPACRRRGLDNALSVSVIEAEAGDDIEAGILGCGHCGAEYPIVDGLPILVPDVRRFVSDNLFYLLSRPNLPPVLESLIGDAAGPESALHSIRQHVSSYVWDHWGEFDPAEDGTAAGAARPGGVARALHAGLGRLSAPSLEGPVLDLGCGPARTTHELDVAGGGLVLGVDLSVPLARAGRRALLERRVDYPRRRVGLVFDRRAFAVPASPRSDLWIADASALPFAGATFAAASAFNLVDCLPDPRAGLVELDRVLRLDGQALLAVPFDWTSGVTPMEGWLGGHSQRAPHAGSAEAVFDMLLTDGPLAVGSLRRYGDPLDVPWHVRLHDRSCMHYEARMVVARRTAT